MYEQEKNTNITAFLQKYVQFQKPMRRLRDAKADEYEPLEVFALVVLVQKKLLTGVQDSKTLERTCS